MKKIIRDKLILIIILLLFQGFNSYGPYRNNGYNDPLSLIQIDIYIVMKVVKVVISIWNMTL